MEPITSENTFTISAANMLLRIRDIVPVIRLAIYRANERKRILTWAWFFGDGFHHKRSRSFHVAISRTLNDEEKFFIEQCFLEVCDRANWGSTKIFFRWGVNLGNGYLEKHDQRWLVKVSPGADFVNT